MAQEQPKPPPTASGQDQTEFRGQTIRTNSQIGPFSQTLKNGAKRHPRERKYPAQEQYELKVLYVSALTTLLTPQYRPSLGLPGLDVEFEAYHLPRLVQRSWK